jgi:hypothetical protein
MLRRGKVRPERITKLRLKRRLKRDDSGEDGFKVRGAMLKKPNMNGMCQSQPMLCT